MSSDPSQITVDHNRRALVITWKDGEVSTLPFNLLRRQCPCATCTDARSKQAATPLTLTLMTGPAITQAEITKIEPVGRYALSLAFNDGHDTGIYTYEFLRSLGEMAARA
jgi:DUF971 family protein